MIFYKTKTKLKQNCNCMFAGFLLMDYCNKNKAYIQMGRIQQTFHLILKKYEIQIQIQLVYVNIRSSKS